MQDQESCKVQIIFLNQYFVASVKYLDILKIKMTWEEPVSMFKDLFKRNNLPQNKNSTSCRFKPVWLTFVEHKRRYFYVKVDGVQNHTDPHWFLLYVPKNTEIFLKISSFMFHRKNEVIQIGNYLRETEF